MKLIALEEHYVTEEIRTAWGQLEPKWQDLSLKMMQPKTQALLEDMAELRLEQMDAAGVDVQVLSLGPGATQSFEPELAARLAKNANDFVAKAIAQRPDRFEGFATLPTPDPQAAARELSRCVEELGFKGALLCGRTRDRQMDHSDFFPIYETAAKLKVPLYIHPQSPQQAVRETYYTGFDEKLDTFFRDGGLGLAHGDRDRVPAVHPGGDL